MSIKTSVKLALTELKNVKMVARNKYGWPGGYSLFINTLDGGCLCAECCRKEFSAIAWDSFNGCSTGWRFNSVSSASELEMADFITENPDQYGFTYCDNCGKILND